MLKNGRANVDINWKPEFRSSPTVSYELALVKKKAAPMSIPGLPRYTFTLRFNFAGEGTV